MRLKLLVASLAVTALSLGGGAATPPPPAAAPSVKTATDSAVKTTPPAATSPASGMTADTAAKDAAPPPPPTPGETIEQLLEKKKLDSSKLFRSGRILLAEVSTKHFPINHHRFDPNIKAAMSQAILVVKLDNGRALSIYDYLIKPAKGFGEFPCVAVREDNGAFDSQNAGTFEQTSPDRFYSLLFLVPPLKPDEREPEYLLRFNLVGETKVPDSLVKFKNLGNADFTSITLVRDEGIQHLPPPAPPAPPAPPPVAAKPATPPPAAKPVAAPAAKPATPPAAKPGAPAPGAKPGAPAPAAKPATPPAKPGAPAPKPADKPAAKK